MADLLKWARAELSRVRREEALLGATCVQAAMAYPEMFGVYRILLESGNIVAAKKELEYFIDFYCPVCMSICRTRVNHRLAL